MVLRVFSFVFRFDGVGLLVGLRFVCAVACAWSETVLYEGLRDGVSRQVALVFACLSAMAPGMFHAGVAFLPSSMAMWGVALAAGRWLGAGPAGGRAAVTWVCALLLCTGWPFPVLALAPVVLHIALFGAGLAVCVRDALLFTAAVALPVAAVDRVYYGFWTSPSVNTVLYNMVGQSSVLYGVEPWTYYLFNSLLNLNLAVVLCLLAPAVLAATRAWRAPEGRRVLVLAAALALWMALMLSNPHKEERFLFVVYPLALALAAYTLSHLPWPVVQAALAVTAVLSVSRTLALTSYYSAPVEVFTGLHQHFQAHPPAGPVTVCMGKEWYRFPSSFFLPSAADSLRFLPSGFTGQLPAPFDAEARWPTRSLRAGPAFFNDRNEQDPARLVRDPRRDCDYIVDSVIDGQREQRYSVGEVVVKAAFLDASRSPRWSRAFWFPGHQNWNGFFEFQVVKVEKGE
jgi:alpha-1,2-mannosyltransferase